MMVTRPGRLDDKVVVVTGAGSGLGRATAIACAAEGATVVATDLDAASAEATAKAIRDKGGAASASRLDVTDRAANEAMAAETLKRHGRIDVLMTFAGLVINGTATEADEAAWGKTLAVNLTGTWLSCRAVLPAMMERKAGALVLVASVGALIGVPNIAAYAASKGGVAALARQMAVDYAPHGVRVNAICPGTVATPLVINHYLNQGLVQPDRIEEGLRAAASKRYPLGRFGTEEQVAALALHLAADEAGFTTGSVIAIDGGLSATGWMVGR